MEERAINIYRLKREFTEKFPEHTLSTILSLEPDVLTAEELIAKAQTWLAFFRRRDENE